MPVLTAHELKKSFVERLLFDGVSFEINEKDRIGLVGVNGCGKSTLFRILTGAEPADSGSIYKSKITNIITMEQSIEDTSLTAMEATLRVFSEFKNAESELETLSSAMTKATGSMLDSLIVRQNELRERYEANGGLTYKSRARSALLGLGLSEADLCKPISELSGGERNKAQLAGVLLADADLLLLDEPTNHLDLDAINWLEDFLKSYRKAFMVISHDRYFLDAVTNRTFEIKNTHFYASNGNYSRHRELMEDEQEYLRRKYNRTQKEIKRIERIIEQQKRWGKEHNFITAASKQKQADRLKATLVAPERDTASIRFSFDSAPVTCTEVMVLKNIGKRFSKPLITNGNLTLRRGERIFLLGPNGCGKTTLLKIILGIERADEGYCILGPGVRTGYYEQHLIPDDPSSTPIEEIRNRYPRMNDTDIRSALGAFLFKGDDVFKEMGSLSGGERARVQLLKLMLSGANLLLLDEPTNHLDIDSREALESALDEYDGSMLIVTHDRYLVERLADRVIDMSESGFEEYFGGYSDYLEQKAEKDRETPAAAVSRSKGSEDYKAQKERQSALNRASGELKRAEERINRAEEEIASLEDMLASPAYASDYIKATELSNEITTKREALETLYSAWEKAQEIYDALTSQH